jgi:hypothetical protein
MHYRLSRRTDGAFWIAAREAEISGDLKRRLSLYDEVGMLDHLQAEAFPETSYFHLLTGNKQSFASLSPGTRGLSGSAYGAFDTGFDQSTA